MITKLRPGERIDDLQLDGYEIIQDPERFCFGIDAVLLSDFVKVKQDETVLDLGTGTGILPILLAAKTKGRHFTGLEIQEESADMARRSVMHNGLEDKIDIVTGDIKEAAEILEPAFFDVIVTNPPYFQNSFQSTGNIPAIFPVCPFIAKWYILSLYFTFNTHTGSNAYFTVLLL